MGQFANSWWVAALAWFTAAVIIALNALLVFLILRGNS
jgi:Mn2+/Fe2+ NRAMP family transporter